MKNKDVLTMPSDIHSIYSAITKFHHRCLNGKSTFFYTKSRKEKVEGNLPDWHAVRRFSFQMVIDYQLQLCGVGHPGITEYKERHVV